MTFRRILVAVVFLSFIISFSSCKTTKKKDEVSKLGKRYQNTTSYYNGFFNADEIYQNSLAVLDRLHKDDFNKILSLYTYRDVPDTKSVTQDLNKVIEKLGRVINLHRASDWVDDSYLLMGKAEYVKQDFEKAQNVFEYFVDEMNPAFKKSNIKTNKKSKKKKLSKKKKSSKKKKKKKKKRRRKKKPAEIKLNDSIAKAKTDLAKTKSEEIKNSTFHVKGSKKEWNTYNEGLLWMARTYIEREKWASAYYLLARLNSESKNDKLKRELPVTKAYYYLKQKKYSESIKPLQDAILYAKKADKARYSFILGQVYETLNNPTDAYTMYKKVGELRPDYEIEFNAKLKLLENYGGSSEGYALKEVKKLLKEEKYFEYKDRIYFTMAEIMFKKNNIDQGIVYLNQSLANNNDNPALKAEAYYKLANIKFDEQEYISSKNYYDSTLLVLDKTDERFPKVKSFAENLTDIAKNLEIIELQDSLIKISKMSDEEQMQIALEIKKKDLEEKKKRLEKQNNSASNARKGSFAKMGLPGNVPGKSRSRLNKSSFFAYNPESIKAGMSEFKKTWGTILLEDDWRRSNKSSGDFGDEEDEIDTKDISLSDAELKTLLKGVPRTPEDLEVAENKIISAMLNLGILYRDNLNNYEKSKEILEKLFNKYSDFDDECKGMYYLQFSYKDLNQYSKADNIVAKMSNKFPDCSYTKILTDPEFVNSNNNIVNAKEDYYKEVFQLYQDGEYQSSLAKIINSDKEFKEDPTYKIKLDYLKSKIKGKTEGKDAYILSLENFIKQYPKSKEAIHARETLRFLKGDKEAFSKLIYEEDLDVFTYQPDKLHYILVIVHNANDDDLKIIKTSISRYNKKYYKLDRLRMSNIYFDTKGKDQVILLRKFDKAASAMKYFNDVSKSKDEFIESTYDFEVYAVSQKNYREVIKHRSINQYRAFFNKYYLKISNNEK